jgi:hypothetical protein
LLSFIRSFGSKNLEKREFFGFYLFEAFIMKAKYLRTAALPIMVYGHLTAPRKELPYALLANQTLCFIGRGWLTKLIQTGSMHCSLLEEPSISIAFLI